MKKPIIGPPNINFPNDIEIMNRIKNLYDANHRKLIRGPIWLSTK